MPRRTYFHVRCDRCGMFQDANHSEGGIPGSPIGWFERGVAPSWAFGGTPETVLLCRDCTGAVDAQMKRAWSGALKPEPQAAGPRDAE